MSKTVPKVYEQLERTKWVAEGMENLDDIAGALEAMAKYFRDHSATGKVSVPQPVDNGYIFMETEDADVANEFGFTLQEWDDEGADYEIEGDEDEIEEEDEEESVES